ncbi:MAG: NAD-binding protein [Candidatus Velthaea sp.]|jgi:Trk K+ transport system NAD-binding subunit
MSGEPLIIVVGGNALALRVCAELRGTQGHRVALLWTHDREIAARLERLGVEYVARAPNDYDALRAAGIAGAVSIMTLDEDDRLNLQVALKARDLNPDIRLVIRQFTRRLGRKIEQNLPNCSVLSLASHAAATYAASALDRACFYAFEFPDNADGVVAGFSRRSASELGVAGLSVAQAQERLQCRVVGVGVGGKDHAAAGRTIHPDEEVVIFGRLSALEAAAPETFPEARKGRPPSLRVFIAQVRSVIRAMRQLDPIVQRIAIGAGVLYVLSVIYFAYALHKDWLTSLYFVNSTVTTVGYGDITPLKAGRGAMLVANGIMFAGVALSGIFVAVMTTALTRAQWVAMQGLRRIHTRGHFVVCGTGNVGTRVIDYLLAQNKRLVVIDHAPATATIELSRDRVLELLTGDATSDTTLDHCNLKHARAIITLTDSDTSNLEVALGARARNPKLPVVMRIQDDTFAQSVARQFGFTEAYSTAALSAPVFAGLSRFAGSRGRIAFGGDEYNIGERQQGEVPSPPPAENCIPLGVWRKGAFHQIDAFDEVEPFDRLLFIVPLSQFRVPPPTAPSAAPESLTASLVKEK